MFFRTKLDLFANVLKVKSIPGIKTRHDDIDIRIIRENTEGEYTNLEHEVRISNGDFFIFILLSRESDRGAVHRTNPESHSLGSCFCFRVLRLSFICDFFNLLLVTFHPAEMIIVKQRIQGRNDEAWMGVEPLTLRSCPS